MLTIKCYLSAFFIYFGTFFKKVEFTLFQSQDYNGTQ